MPTDPVLSHGAAEPELVLARATIHLPEGIFPGGWYWIDPSLPEVQVYIKRGYLVPDVEPDVTPAVAAQEPAQEPEPEQVEADDDEPEDDDTEPYSASSDDGVDE